MITKLHPYPKYKETGVEWLDKVPESWDVLPNRTLFYEIKDSNHPEEPLLSVTISRGIVQQSDLLSNSSKKDSSNEDKTKYKLVVPGDIAYNKMRAWQGSIGISKFRGIVSPAYIIQRPRKTLNADYFHYLFRTPSFAKEAERWSYGITSDQWSLRSEHFRMIYSSLPSIQEQNLIVKFVKYTTNKIQKFINTKQKLIKLLEEQKQAIIHQAVTGAIDVQTGKPYPKYSNFEVGYLKAIPSNWKLSKIKFVCSIHNGADHKHIETTHGYPVLGSGGQFSYASSFLYNKVSVLFGRKGTIDKPLYIEEPFWTVDTMFYTKIHKNVLPKYLFFIAKIIPYDYYSTKTALPSMTQTILGNHKMPLPPIRIQENIVDYIESKLITINSTFEHTKREIELLKEYKTRLISDVVTGKIDVREIAKTLPDDVAIEEILDEVEESNEEIIDDDSVFEENESK